MRGGSHSAIPAEGTATSEGMTKLSEGDAVQTTKSSPGVSLPTPVKVMPNYDLVMELLSSDFARVVIQKFGQSCFMNEFLKCYISPLSLTVILSIHQSTHTL